MHEKRHANSPDADVGAERGAAGAVDQAHDRDAQIARHHLGADLFFLESAVRRAATHREIIARHHDGAAVERAASHHEVGRHEIRDIACRVIARLAGDTANLAERAGVEELLDALPDRELAGLLVTLDALGTSATALGNIGPGFGITGPMGSFAGLGDEPVSDELANLVVAQMLFLANEDPKTDIHLYVNSPGGSVSAGLAMLVPVRLL